MRSILSISLPQEIKNRIIERAKTLNKSISAYILHALRIEESLISEDDLVKMAKKAEQDYNSGKTTKLNSLADLME